MPSTPLQLCKTPGCSNLVSGGYCHDCKKATLQETKITIVAGAPCSGKTTYVQAHKKPGDLVVDLDALRVALGSDDTHEHDASLLPFAIAAERAILERLSQPHDARHVWIIRTAPRIKDRHIIPTANVIVIDPGIHVCQDRANTRPAWTKHLISLWYDTYEPHSRDHHAS